MPRSVCRLVLLLCAAVALIGLLYPLWVIRPFRHQGAGELQVALFVLQYRDLAEAVAAVLATVTMLMMWRWEPRPGRSLAVATTALVLGSAALARVNVYEQMFHPVNNPAFETVQAAKLNAAEKVLTIHVGDTARAYPVRSLSYHHIVNDTVGGVPVAATY
jgi:hypothetical protein